MTHCSLLLADDNAAMPWKPLQTTYYRKNHSLSAQDAFKLSGDEKHNACNGRNIKMNFLWFRQSQGFKLEREI